MHDERLKLSALRSIGWTLWNPIGLSRPALGEAGDDEYDAYLLCAARLLLAGSTREEAINSLVTAEIKNMGLALTADARSRAEATVAAITSHISTLSAPKSGS